MSRNPEPNRNGKNGERHKRSFKEWLRHYGFIALSQLVYGEIDKRLEVKDALAEALKHPVPKWVNWTYCFGGMTFFLFISQAITGVLLTFYYQPAPEGAYESVKYIMNDVSFGWFIRGLHKWGSEGMILMVFLHAFRVFFMGAYKPPRELNWIVGVCLLGVTVFFGFTGYLLPWDQVAFWATTVGTKMAGDVPYVGEWLRYVLRGSEAVGSNTLTRFFSLHVIVLPVAISVLLLMHFGMIRRQGVSEPL